MDCDNGRCRFAYPCTAPIPLTNNAMKTASDNTPSQPSFDDVLKKQKYARVGTHSAVKPCLWLKRSIRGGDGCYKSRFYGIESHRCIQLTPTFLCNQKCVFCWRPTEIEAPIPKWESPEKLVDMFIAAQMKFISGYGGADTTDMERLGEAKQPKHAAISLIGEPTTYPDLAGLIDEFHRRDMSTFVVTNGTNPEMIRQINPTQLYMSLDAPDEATYMKICAPESATWQNVLESLGYMAEKNGRTAIRITSVKGHNMFDPEGYARLIAIAHPDFVEVKAYMHLGYSRNRLERECMPSHDDVLDFAEKIADECGYQIADSVELSRVVLLTPDGTLNKIE